MSKFELVPISIDDPASVVRARSGAARHGRGTPERCCSSLLAGMSIATIGVVLISAETNPTGGMSRRSACAGLCTVASNRYVARDTTPVCSTPFAITSIAAIVMTPAQPGEQLVGSGDSGEAGHHQSADQRQHGRDAAGGHRRERDDHDHRGDDRHTRILYRRLSRRGTSQTLSAPHTGCTQVL